MAPVYRPCRRRGRPGSGYAVLQRSVTSMAPLPANLAPLALGGESWVEPSYTGQGLANLAPSILRILVGPSAARAVPPLATEALPERLQEGIRAVVLLLADGLGYLQLRDEVARGNAPAIAAWLRRAEGGATDAHASVVTSVFPSTTVAALGSLNSSVLPAEHGLLGYTLLLREMGGLADMIRWGPLDRRGSYADPTHGEHQPEAFFATPTLFQQLREAGVCEVHTVNPATLRGTPLSRMLLQGAQHHAYAASSGLASIIPRLVRAETARTYVYAYWPTVDTVSHMEGPWSPEHGDEVAALDRTVERLIDRLPHDGDVLLLLTADHGHLQCPLEHEILLDDYPDLLALLDAPPAGERRVTYLYARPGLTQPLAQLARERLGTWAVVLTRDEAVALGLFGPVSGDEPHFERVGDVLLLARGDYQLRGSVPLDAVPPAQRPPAAATFRGLHGGLSPAEQLVPLLALRV